MAEKFKEWAKDVKNKKFVILFTFVVLLALGITFFPFQSNGGGQKVTTVSKQAVSNESTDYETTLERKLVNMLSKMEGVGTVSVMVTTDSNEEKILAENTSSNQQRTEEKDQAGGTRNTDSAQQTNDVVLQNGNTPYVVKEYAPQIRGVFILAEGAEDSEVKNQIVEAVSKLLDVPVHKISVEKKKN